MKENTFDFIKRHGLDASVFDMSALTKEYTQEMQQGLDSVSSLDMIPSYIKLGSITKNTPVCIIDAGGTNLRTARAMINEDGSFELLSAIRTMPTPGTQVSCTAQEFFDIVSEALLCDIKDGDRIAFSFSFPAEVMPDLDARVIKINKELRLYDMQDLYIGRELKKALFEKGIKDVSVTVLNDAVATCLAGFVENEGKYDTYTGTIIGTGTNSCYFEKAENIGKIKENSGEMIINIETGGYDKTPQSDIDIDFCGAHSITGCRPAEMQISGGYLGMLFKSVLKRAHAEGVIKLISDAALKTHDIDDFLRGRKNAVCACVSESSIDDAKDIANALTKRAAFLSALQLTAMAEKTGGKNILMMMEGTTYSNLYGFKQETQRVAKEYLSKKGVNIEITETKNAVLKGCTVAALMNR